MAFGACANLDGLGDGLSDAGTDARLAPDAPGARDAPDSPDAFRADDGDTGADDGDAPHDAAAQTWCQSQHPAPIFCADFDTSAEIGAGWTLVARSNGTLATNPDAFQSPPRAAVARSNDADGGVDSGDIKLFLQKAVTATGSTFYFAFDVRLDAISAGADLSVADLTLANGSALAYGAQLIVNANDMLVEERVSLEGGLTFSRTPLSRAAVLGEWARVELEGAMPPSGKLTVRIAGQTVLNQHPMPAAAASGSPSIGVGLTIYGARPASPSQVRFDNVTFDVK